MSMSKTSLLRWLGRAVLGGLLVTVLHLENARADLVQAPAGTCCQIININNLEDARGYCDSRTPDIGGTQMSAFGLRMPPGSRSASAIGSPEKGFPFD